MGAMALVRIAAIVVVAAAAAAAAADPEQCGAPAMPLSARLAALNLLGVEERVRRRPFPPPLVSAHCQEFLRPHIGSNACRQCLFLPGVRVRRRYAVVASTRRHS